jgi:hypothetical protein
MKDIACVGRQKGETQRDEATETIDKPNHWRNRQSSMTSYGADADVEADAALLTRT